MKNLIVYYSRTNVTEKVAKEIRQEFDCDMEEIIETKSRSGITGWIKSCYDAIRGNFTEINPTKNNAENYDLVIVGTPVWASNMANPVLTYLNENKSKFNQVAFFCTCNSSGYSETLAKMEEIVEKKPLETLAMNKSDINSSNNSKIEIFATKIKNKVG